MKCKQALSLVAVFAVISCLIATSCDCPWRKYDNPVLRAYMRDSLSVLEGRCEELLSNAYMTQHFVEERTDIPDWEGFPVKLYEYETGIDIKTHQPKKGKVYLLNPSARQLATWIVTSVWAAKGRLDYQDIQKFTQFILWQSSAQFPVKGVVYEDMYTAGFYEPYVFKDGVTVYIADSTYFPQDTASKTCTEEMLDFYLNLTNKDLKSNTGRYARICSTTREMYLRCGGKRLDVGDSQQDRSVVWLEVVRELYQQAWHSDTNELMIAWCKTNL